MSCALDSLSRTALAGVLAIGLGMAVSAAPATAQSSGPALTVSVVVDQLRPDLLEKYDAVWTGGIRRLLDEGHSFTQASHAHARTSTAPGHASLTTGVLPSRHGLVANTWWQKQGFRWQNVYAVLDNESPILGYENVGALEGRSPAQMLREGLPDWFGQTNEDSRRVSISRKDRAAIPMGGKHTEHVFWMVPELARWVTSTHYMDDYPRWLERFNERVMPELFEPEVWENQVPMDLRWLTRPDSAPYEGDGVHTVFPHVSSEENADTARTQHYYWASDQPRSDDATMALAHVVIEELDLGQRDDPDYLAVALSSTDRVGHAYGPFSQEVLSTLVNVDLLLGDFFDYLDEEVGEGRWVVGFTSDHGVVANPEYSQSLGDMEAERIDQVRVRARLSEALNEAVRGGGNQDEIAERLARMVEDRGIATKAYTHFELTRGMPADSFGVLYRNSYYPGRAWDDLSRFGVDLRYGEGDYVGFPTGTNHETPYWYDRWVPMIFMGPGIEPGSTETPVYSVDFAPTLAALAGIGVPDDLDGRRIY